MSARSRPRVAVVIGSGAVKCAAALGLRKVLEGEGIPIDLLVGCSGGSLYAATMALGVPLDAAIANTRALWNRRITAKRNWRALLGAAMPGVFGFDERFGMVDDGPMLAALRSVFGDTSFADARIPLRILAADFRDGEPVVLAEGRLLDALRASIAIPFIWAPWQVGDRLLMDGSAADPMPVDVAIKDGYEIIIAMGFDTPLPRKVRSLSRFAFHVNGIMTNNLYRANYAFHNIAHHAEIITLTPQFDRPITLFDTDQIPYVIEQGERAATEYAPYLRTLLKREA